MREMGKSGMSQVISGPGVIAPGGFWRKRQGRAEAALREIDAEPFRFRWRGR